MKSFQTILLAICAGFVVLAVLIFSGLVPLGKDNQEVLLAEPVVLWGTLPSEQWDTLMRQAVAAEQKFSITYVEKKESTFESDLVEALASGVGPDIILGKHTVLLRERDRLLQLPFASLTERTYRDSFADSASSLLSAGGVWGLPLYSDPLVMYYNRALLTNALLPTAPKTWEEIQLYPEKLTTVDGSGNITQAAVALGTANNVTHYKEILSAQIMQTGNSIVSRRTVTDPEGVLQDEIEASLSTGSGAPSVLRFYTEFTNAALKKYSWNTAKKSSLDEFAAGRLALYFGLASDLAVIRDKNPHLDFDIAQIPQATAGSRLTYADVYALAIIKNSTHAPAAFAVISGMSLGPTAGLFSTELALPPVRRDLLSAGNPDPLYSVLYTAAIIGKNWFDPDALVTKSIFSSMVESVMIGKSTPEVAVAEANSRITDLLK